jgi:hypothetical protein
VGGGEGRGKSKYRTIWNLLSIHFRGRYVTVTLYGGGGCYIGGIVCIYNYFIVICYLLERAKTSIRVCLVQVQALVWITAHSRNF